MPSPFPCNDDTGVHETKTKNPGALRFQGFRISWSRLTLAELRYLLGDHQALLKTPEKTEMVLRFPLGFA